MGKPEAGGDGSAGSYLSAPHSISNLTPTHKEMQSNLHPRPKGTHPSESQTDMVRQL